MIVLVLLAAKLLAPRGAMGWRALVLLAALAPGPAARAQAGQPFQLARRGARRAVLKFDMQRNLIVVAARLNGLGPYHFLLDTGVATSLITNPALADSLHLVLGEELRVVGAGGEDTPLRAYRTNTVRVEMPGVLTPAMSWLILSNDALNLSGYAGTRIDGILGSEFFRSLTVAIWPLRGELVCHAPDRFRPPRRWASLPLLLIQNKAYIETGIEQLPAETGLAPAGPPAPLRLLLDTGAGHALSLETTADRRLHLPATHLRADLGRGLSGIITGYLGRVGAVRLGRYQLGHVLTSFPDSGQVHLRLRQQEGQRHGNLGYEALKRFNIIIDYPHQRLLLHPNGQYHQPFEHDMSGLDLLAAGPGLRHCLITSVAAGSPAEAAGVLPDDELLAINALPAAALSLSEIARLLRLQDGQRLHLVLRRADGELRAVSFQLRRQI